MKEEKTKQFDIFMENYNVEQISNTNNHYKYTYMSNLRKMFQSKINVMNDEIKINEKYPNYRFHYMDIRNTIPNVNDLYNDFSVNLCSSDILIKLEKLVIDLKHLFELMFEDELIAQNKYLKKILYNYSNLNVKQQMNKLYNMIIINLTKIIYKIEQLYKFAQDNILKHGFPQFKTDDYNKLCGIYDQQNFFLKTISTMNDLYFLRRFLDKSYVKNCILYVGMAHLVNVSFILVKYFDFKITNIFSVNPEFDINQIQTLKFDSLDFNDIMMSNIVNKLPNYEYAQCVNLFNFPENFS
jgi:hypothetical protein